MSSAALFSVNSEQEVDRELEELGLAAGKPLKIVCVGAHPDDPETGCGGTLAKFAAKGHDVRIIYLTRGEAGIKEGERQTTAWIRTGESLRACTILQGHAVFAGQIDGETGASPEQSRNFTELLAALQPDVVFTHWPIDTHHDHRTAAQLVYNAWQALSERFTLVYYEVMTGVQTHHFRPNCFINIGSTWDQKRLAIYAHESQNPNRFYPYHVEIEKQRGEEADLERAEAFVVVREKWPKPLLPFTM
jgi:LmbE family N-acetylglucosaminyl deacetylase